MFSIKTESLRLELEVVPVESLFIHERILPGVAKQLTLEFKNLANLENPIIVDRNDIVLDGNHRTYAFRELAFKYIPVCRIDYLHGDTQLRYWFRLLGNIKDRDLIREVVEELGGSLQEVTDRESMERMLEEDCYRCGVQQASVFSTITFSTNMVNDAVGAYDMLEKIQDRLTARGIALEYVPCQHVNDDEFCEALRDQEIIIWTPQITKEMVVEAARQKRLFAPKTTRHLIPARPLNVNIPTHWFRGNITLEEINRRFASFLEGKGMRRLSPGQVIEGRFYEEELFVFFDKRK
jgi:hypothetical protein